MSPLIPRHFKASHCSIYPGQVAGNLGEDSWRSSSTISVGDNALSHTVTHKGASGVPLWVMRERDTKPGCQSPYLPVLFFLKPEPLCEMGRQWGCRGQAPASFIG